MRIVLASESPFRKRALDLLGLPYETFPAAIDEKAVRHEDPAELTLLLAEAKARKVAAEFKDAIIVAGDAVAAKGANIYEKPRNLDEAALFLRELSGSEFQFITSLVVMNSGVLKSGALNPGAPNSGAPKPATGKMLSTVETLNITFRPLIEREIQAYVAKYPVLNFAGAFEDDAVHLFAERISGSYNIGTALPVSRLIVFLREQGVEI